MTVYRLADSFPFDSSKPTKFDDYGRPILDRAASSQAFRDALAKIFTNGVFGSPADAFIISKGDGLSVRINPGLCVIEGGMGGWRDEARTFALPAATGKVAYGIFLRLDDNIDMRSIYVRIEAGAAGTNPVPPEPETSEKVKELRLGYVVVPSAATDLSGATIVNEKGLAVCPYAMPFAEIDLAEIIHDAQVYAEERNAEFTAYLLDNMEFIASALDGTVAGNLQAQIDELREGAFSADNVDPRNLEIEADTPTGTKLLRISDNFVDGELAKIDAETRKLALQVQAIREAAGLGADNQALRAAMGLGNTLGVLGVEYGGTGMSGKAEKSILINEKYNSSSTFFFSGETVKAGTYLLMFLANYNSGTPSIALKFNGNYQRIDPATTPFLQCNVIEVTEDTTLGSNTDGDYLMKGSNGSVLGLALIPIYLESF